MELSQVGWDGVGLVGPLGVDVGVVDQVAAFWVFGYVVFLVDEVFCVADAVFVVTWVPHFAFELFADGVRETAFDELQTAGEGLAGGWSYEHVHVVGHEDEGVELVAGLFAVAKEDF